MSIEIKEDKEFSQSAQRYIRTRCLSIIEDFVYREIDSSKAKLLFNELIDTYDLDLD